MTHPLNHIAAAAVDRIRETAFAAEQLKHLHPLQLSLIQEQNWFNLVVHKKFGGLELSLPEALKTEEAWAWADGSFGWTATLCAGANWFIGFLDPAVATAFFRDPLVCLAGSGKAAGVAKIKPGGYEITGAWNYATGAAHATAFTANCVVEKNGTALLKEDGSPLVQSFIFLRDEVSITDNWFTMGMIATGSFRFEANHVYVPANRTFLIEPGYSFLESLLYQYPFLQFAETTLAVNFSGMALRFLELAPKSVARDGIQTLHAQRQLFYNAVERSWDQLMEKEIVERILLEEVSEQSKKLALISRQWIDAIYPFCGMQAANPATEINRIWRNIHTASQHSLLNTSRP
jgi:alkylation response protein AidB-like acyl-CoA dehydrogenase